MKADALMRFILLGNRSLEACCIFGLIPMHCRNSTSRRWKPRWNATDGADVDPPADVRRDCCAGGMQPTGIFAVSRS
jgi:hypothetical protein